MYAMRLVVFLDVVAISMLIFITFSTGWAGTKANTWSLCTCEVEPGIGDRTHYREVGYIRIWMMSKLCRFHHTQLHKGHYTIDLQEQTQKNHGQKWIFTTAAGEVIEPNPRLPEPTTDDFFAVQWPHVNSQTAASRWQGKPLNDTKILGDLQQCKHQHWLVYKIWCCHDLFEQRQNWE